MIINAFSIFVITILGSVEINGIEGTTACAVDGTWWRMRTPDSAAKANNSIINGASPTRRRARMQALVSTVSVVAPLAHWTMTDDNSLRRKNRTGQQRMSENGCAPKTDFASVFGPLDDDRQQQLTDQAQMRSPVLTVSVAAPRDRASSFSESTPSMSSGSVAAGAL